MSLIQKLKGQEVSKNPFGEFFYAPAVANSLASQAFPGNLNLLDWRRVGVRGGKGGW